MDNLTIDQTSRAVVSRMEHLHLYVDDLEASIEFYQELFRFEVRYRGTNNDGSETVHIGSDRFYLSLTRPVGEVPAGTGRVNHIGFVTADLDAFWKRLDGSRFSKYNLGGASRKEGDALYLNDPNGLHIEVVSYRQGYAYR